ncbi:MAG: Ig-like domain-containing protein [Candidatus Latescibacterota bacterium]
MVPWIAALLLAVCSLTPIDAQTIRTIAGTGTAGFSGDGAQADSAAFNSPVGVHGDNTGQTWVADTGNHRIRRITATFDTVVTYAGTGTVGYTGDGSAATAATLNAPTDVFVDTTGNVWIADTGNHVIRKITTAGVISTVAGTGARGFSGDAAAATSAQLNSPAGVYVTNGGVIYIADRGNHRVRRVSAAGTITTIAGTGVPGFSGDGSPAGFAQLDSPSDVFLDTSGTLYIVDTNNHCLRAIAASDNTISTIAGTGGAPGFSGDGGVATNARFAFPRAVFVDTSGSIYIADRFNHRIRRINTSGDITTLAGDGVLGASGDGAAANVARLGSPAGVWLYDNRELFIADSGNHRVRRVDDDNALGLSGTTTIGLGREVRIFSAAFTGDGITAVKGLRLTISDLTSATGLDTSDFAEFRLYESPDSLFSATDTLRGTVAAGDIALGTTFTVQASPSPVPPAGQRRHYIITALLADDGVEGHSFRVGFLAGGLSTTIGGHGMPILAANANRVTIDVVATQLVFTTQPDGVISSLPLGTQPVISAVDDLGYVDGNFTETITLTVSGGSGSLLQSTATAVAGVATFSSVTYVAAIDQEPFALVADDETGGAEGDLPTATSNTLVANTENDPPVVIAFSFTIDEDDSVTVPITSMVSDVDDSLSTLILTFSARHTQATLEGTQLTIRPDPDYFGPDTLRITAEDAFGAVASDKAILTIKSVNDRPVLTPLGRRTIDEDDTMIVDLTVQVTDVETPFSGIQWTFVPSTGLSTSFSATTGLLKAWAPPDSSGTFTLGITAFDAEGTAATTLDTIDVAAVNDLPSLEPQAPMISAIPQQTVEVGDTLDVNLSDYVSDPDHPDDVLIWTVSTPALGSASITDGVLQLITEGNDGYTAALTVIATDPDGLQASGALTVTVTELPPLLTSFPDSLVIDVAGGELLLDSYLGAGVSPASVTWSALASGDLDVVIDPETRVVSITPADGSREGGRILFTAMTTKQSASDSINIRVANVTPIVDLPDLFLDAGESAWLLFDDFVSDDDDINLLTWSATPLDTGLTVSINQVVRTLTLTTTEDVTGDLRVAFAATDEQGASGLDTMIVSVRSPETPPDSSLVDTTGTNTAPVDTTGTNTAPVDTTGTNTAPVVGPFTVLSFLSGTEGRLTLDNVVVDDEPVDGILWAAETFGGVSAVIDDVRRLTVTAIGDFTGTTTIRLTATDIFGARGSGTLVVEVRAQVDSPMAGDFDRSGGVDLDDFFALVDELGSSVFTPGFDASFDLNDDARITFDDFFLFLDIYEARRLDR